MSRNPLAAKTLEFCERLIPKMKGGDRIFPITPKRAIKEPSSRPFFYPERREE